MTDDARQVSVSRRIAAPADTIFSVLADPTRHPELDGSGTVKQATFGPARLALGEKFGMKMRMGLPYRIASTVVEFEEGRRIAWAHLGKHRWRYELEPVDGGAATMVTETFDWSTARSPRFIEMMGYPKKHPAAMQRSLERLESLVTTP
jgi:uncharacterized protein YndB with AHSA1/START domain